MSETENSRPPLLFIGFVILLAVLAFALLLAMVLAGGGGIAWVLHRYWPAIDTGTGMLIGLIGLAITAQVCLALIRLFSSDTKQETSSVIRYDPDDDDLPPYLIEMPPLRRTPRKRPQPRRPERGRGAA